MAIQSDPGMVANGVFAISTMTTITATAAVTGSIQQFLLSSQVGRGLAAWRRVRPREEGRGVVG